MVSVQWSPYNGLLCSSLARYFAEFLESATLAVSESGNAILDLSKFEAAISKYRQVQAEINDLVTPSDIGWIRVNSQPMKQALGVWATKWIYMHTQHLVDHVTSTLSGLHTMITRIDSGLDEEVAGEDKGALKRVMGHIRDVRKSMDETSDTFAPLRETVNLLKGHGLTMSDVQIGNMGINEYLEEAPLAWDALINKNFKKKEEIIPLQNAEVDQIKTKLDKFFLDMRQFRGDFRANAPFEAVDMPPAEVYVMCHMLAPFEAFAPRVATRTLAMASLEAFGPRVATRTLASQQWPRWKRMSCVMHVCVRAPQIWKHSMYQN